MAAYSRRVVVLNPISGGGRRASIVRRTAAARGYECRESAGPGETLSLAREAAADGADLVVAAGGDGTLNEVVRGVDAADALDETVIGLVPCGTGNSFADRLGLRRVGQAFDVLDRGHERRLDLGVAADRLFVNSCVGGLTARASERTSTEMKRRWGVLAYVVATLREYRTFEGVTVDVTGADGRSHWEGEAIGVLVGNARRFVGEPRAKADVEDGLLNVVLIQRVPAVELASDAAVRRFFGGEASHLSRFLAPEIRIATADGTAVHYSLDGEMIRSADLSVRTRERAMRFVVGDAYRPDPRGANGDATTT